MTASQLSVTDRDANTNSALSMLRIEQLRFGQATPLESLGAQESWRNYTPASNYRYQSLNGK